MADQFNLGRHEALIERLVRGQDEIFNRLGDVENLLAEKKGERRVTAALWSASGGAIGALVVFVAKAWLTVHGI